MDIITIIVTALATGTAAAQKPGAEPAVADAYAGLKSLIDGNGQRLVPLLLQLEDRAPGGSIRQAEASLRVRLLLPGQAGKLSESIEDLGEIHEADRADRGARVRKRETGLARHCTMDIDAQRGHENTAASICFPAGVDQHVG